MRHPTYDDDPEFPELPGWVKALAIVGIAMFCGWLIAQAIILVVLRAAA